MSGYVNPVFRPDFTDYPAAPQNRLASGFNAIWPASNPVGTETTQGMQSAMPTDQIAFMRPDGTPVMASDMAAAHQQVQQAMQTAPTMALGMVGDAPGIRAFHGSPYDFERFDTSKIGTGEGNQAFGYGLYAAEKEATAQSYKGGGYSFQGKPLDPRAGWSPEGAAAGWFEQPKPGETMGDMISRRAQELQDHGDFMASSAESRNRDAASMYYNAAEKLRAQNPADWAQSGRMYEVNIGADPEQFLHWDKPLSEQSPYVQKALTDNWMAHPIDHAHQTGRQIYGAQGGSSEEVATALRDAGIPGIRYLDQGSRGAQPPIKLVGGKPYDPSDPTHIASHAVEMAGGDRTAAAAIADRQVQLRAGQGDAAGADAMRQASALLQSPRAIPALTEGQPPATHNYVVFDAATIDILRKYGLAGLGIGLGATAAGTQQQSQ
jgi:hypothetical protein